MKERFWFVWCESAGMPRHKHQTEESANKEAERLARLHRGQTFVVLMSAREFVTVDVVRVEHQESELDVPF
jgi:hypothetical protein